MNRCGLNKIFSISLAFQLISINLKGIEMRQDDDEVKTLIDAVKQGDQQAFDQLVERYRNRLMPFVRKIIGPGIQSTKGPEDVFQDVFLYVMQSIYKFKWKGEPSFFSWLCTCAKFRVWNGVRKKGLNPIDQAQDLSASNTSPSKAMRREQRFDRLEKAILELDPDQQQALIMARIEGMKQNKIAEIMNISDAKVSRLINGALGALKLTLEDTESLHLPDRTFNFGKEQENE